MTYRLRLDVFEGPFDLLLYLIKKNEIDIYDIPIAKILEEFLEYVELIRVLDLEVAGDFILMASTLMQIKSRMLLPQESLALEAGEEADPRADLVRRLLEYKRFREVAGMLEQNEQLQRRRYWRPVSVPTEEELAEASAADLTGPFQEVNLFDLLAAFKRVAAYAAPETFREIQPEEIKTSQKINEILDALEESETLDFTALMLKQGTRLGMVTVFLAILELARLKAIEVFQEHAFDEIKIKRVDEFTAAARLAAAGKEAV